MTGATVLVADDDAAIRTVLNQALSRAGYDVRALVVCTQPLSFSDFVADAAMPKFKNFNQVGRTR